MKCALHFNQCEKILFGCEKGTLIVCEGHQNNKILMSKKIVVEQLKHLSINNVLMTNRSEVNFINLALCTESGLFFIDLELP